MLQPCGRHGRTDWPGRNISDIAAAWSLNVAHCIVGSLISHAVYMLSGASRAAGSAAAPHVIGAHAGMA